MVDSKMQNERLMGSSNMGQKDKAYTLQNINNRINRTEPVTYGNYFVNFAEMFKNESEYTDYMKKRVSLFNDDFVDKKEFKGNNGSYLKPTYFGKFSDETLFYIFYYMTRDTLQLFAAEQLYKNGWKYHVDYQIWFKENTEEGKINEPLSYFNPLEWKTSQFVYGYVNPEAFLDLKVVEEYVAKFQIKNN